MDVHPDSLLPNPLDGLGTQPPLLAGRRPPIEFFQHEEALFLQVGLPGVGREDLEVGFASGCLFLRGQRRFHGSLPADARCLAGEIHYGPFHFELAIHPYFDAGEMEHELTDGMLRIRIPRRSPKRGQ